MTGKLKKLLVLLPLVMAVLLVLTIWLADSWLESSQGRNRLQAALSDALGMPVRLQGDFSISLLPSLGIAGAGLLIGGDEGEELFLRSDRYHVVVALRPLLAGKLNVLAVRAANGLVEPARYTNLRSTAPGSSSRRVRLPQIDRLSLEDFSILLPGERASTVQVHRLELVNFQAGMDTPLALDFSFQSQAGSLARFVADSSLNLDSKAEHLSLAVNDMEVRLEAQAIGGITGRLSWSVTRELLEAQFRWHDAVQGTVVVSSSFSTDSLAGNLTLNFTPPDQALTAVAKVQFAVSNQGIEFPLVQMTAGGQQASGRGCIRTGEASALHLLLASERIDLDPLQSLLPDGDGDSHNEVAGIPFELNVILSAGEIHAAGATARQAQIRLGEQPDCSVAQE